MGKRTKYKTRPDGRRATSRTYNGEEDFNLSHYVGKKYFYGDSDSDIDRKIADFEASLQRDAKTNQKTFEEIADAWWEEKRKEISPNNVRSYHAHYRNAVADLGETLITSVTTQMLIAHLKQLAAQGFSQKVIKNRKSVIRGILNYALADGLIRSNPCVDLPIIKGKPAEDRAPAPSEDLSIIEATKSESNYSRMMYFMQYTGCRRGEAAALQQKHIDRKNGKASICQSVAYDEQDPILKFPKTKAGVREVDLYDNVLEILPQYDDDEIFVFFPEGLPRKGQLERGLKKYQTDHGLSSTAHQLRHSYASMLHSAHVDAKDAQHLLGHSSIVVTEDIYTSLETAHKAEIREQVNQYVMDRLGEKKKCCPKCGSTYVKSEDGHEFAFCPDCGSKLSN